MDVVRLHSFRALYDLELHALILVQRPETRDVDGLVVDEDVLSLAVVDSDETETLVGFGTTLTVPRAMLFSCEN